MSSPPHAPLKFLFPGWYAIPMGLSGLALAWHRAASLMGETATGVALVIGLLAAAIFTVLLVATLLRWQRHPEAWEEDRRHPVRHTFIATLPIATMLLATVAVALLGPNPVAEAVWWVGSVATSRGHLVGAVALVERQQGWWPAVGGHHAGLVHSHRGQCAGAAGRRAAGP